MWNYRLICGASKLKIIIQAKKEFKNGKIRKTGIRISGHTTIAHGPHQKKNFHSTSPREQESIFVVSTQPRTWIYSYRSLRPSEQTDSKLAYLAFFSEEAIASGRGDQGPGV